MCVLGRSHARHDRRRLHRVSSAGDAVTRWTAASVDALPALVDIKKLDPTTSGYTVPIEYARTAAELLRPLVTSFSDIDSDFDALSDPDLDRAVHELSKRGVAVYRCFPQVPKARGLLVVSAAVEVLAQLE